MKTLENDWLVEFDNRAEKYHRIGAWVAITLNMLWFIGDYFEIPEYWEQFFYIRLTVSITTLVTFLGYKKVNMKPHWLIFVPFLGIALQNAYMYSVMDTLQLQKHTFAYIALFIGAGMLILWKPLYSFIVVGLNLVANLITFPLFSPLSLEEVLINGGLLTFTVTIFTILLIHTRYKLTRKEIKARLGLEASKKEIQQKNKDITDSIIYAKRIQEAILPDQELVSEHLKEYFTLYIPRDIVCGDFYWFTHQDGKSFIAAVDCTGHGVPGAFMSMIGNTLLNEIVIEKKVHHPAEILNKLKSGVIKALKQSGEDDRKEGMDIGLCAIDLKTMKLEYAGAFNPLYLIRDGELIETKADKMPIGKYIRAKDSFTNHTINLQPKDTFYVFSDGFVDQFGGEEGRKYMSKRFKNFLLGLQDLDMDAQQQAISKEFYDWMAVSNQSQIDDVCVIGVRV